MNDEAKPIRVMVADDDASMRARARASFERAEKAAQMRQAWVVVQPSPKEGWGITNLEAAACGTPTIASFWPSWVRMAGSMGPTPIVFSAM